MFVASIKSTANSHAILQGSAIDLKRYFKSSIIVPWKSYCNKGSVSDSLNFFCMIPTGLSENDKQENLMQMESIT